MHLHLAAVLAFLVLPVTGCGGAKPPPGWPAGEERPINVAPVTKESR